MKEKNNRRMKIELFYYDVNDDSYNKLDSTLLDINEQEWLGLSWGVRDAIKKDIITSVVVAEVSPVLDMNELINKYEIPELIENFSKGEGISNEEAVRQVAEIFSSRSDRGQEIKRTESGK